MPITVQSFFLALNLIFGMVFMQCDSMFGKSTPDNILEEKVYLDLLIETQLLAVVQEMSTSDSLMLLYKNELFEEYSTTEQTFLESHKYYQSQIDEQIVRISLVQQRLDSLVVKLQNEATADSLKEIR